MTARTYRFGDASRPGLLLGLGPRQAVPVVAGLLWFAASLQTPAGIPGGLLGVAVGCGIAFGRWRRVPLAEVLAPAAKLWAARRTGRQRWVRTSLLATIPEDRDGHEDLPLVLKGIELLDMPPPTAGAWRRSIAIVHDRRTGWLTAVVRVRGRGFPLASGREQDVMLAGWGHALSPFAREQSPVVRVTWQDWAHPEQAEDHRAFLDSVDIAARADVPETSDYLDLLDAQAPATVAHDVLVAVTVDQRLVRSRRSAGSRLATGVEALCGEVRLFESRLHAAGLVVDHPLTPPELSAAIRLRSDPGRAAQVTTLGRSLAAAAGRAAVEWGPMTLQPEWGHLRVDGALHRAYRVASWPALPVAADWLAPLLVEVTGTRTVCLVMSPVPMSRAARAADREVMAREADAEMKERKGFRINARERRRLADVSAREQELSEGHAEFRFVGLVDVCAPDLDKLEHTCAQVEQAAAQSLIDLRPLEARHDQGWVACLPLGRDVAGRGAV